MLNYPWKSPFYWFFTVFLNSCCLQLGSVILHNGLPALLAVLGFESSALLPFCTLTLVKVSPLNHTCVHCIFDNSLLLCLNKMQHVPLGPTCVIAYMLISTEKMSRLCLDAYSAFFSNDAMDCLFQLPSCASLLSLLFQDLLLNCCCDLYLLSSRCDFLTI